MFLRRRILYFAFPWARNKMFTLALHRKSKKKRSCCGWLLLPWLLFVENTHATQRSWDILIFAIYSFYFFHFTAFCYSQIWTLDTLNFSLLPFQTCLNTDGSSIRKLVLLNFDPSHTKSSAGWKESLGSKSRSHGLIRKTTDADPATLAIKRRWPVRFVDGIRGSEEALGTLFRHNCSPLSHRNTRMCNVV